MVVPGGKNAMEVVHLLVQYIRHNSNDNHLDSQQGVLKGARRALVGCRAVGFGHVAGGGTVGQESFFGFLAITTSSERGTLVAINLGLASTPVVVHAGFATTEHNIPLHLRKLLKKEIDMGVH